MGYPQGGSLRLTAQFREDGALADPDIVRVRVRPPGATSDSPTGSEFSFTYGTDSELTRASQGIYQALVNKNAAGSYRVRWEARDAAGLQEAFEMTFQVDRSTFGVT